MKRAALAAAGAVLAACSPPPAPAVRAASPAPTTVAAPAPAPEEGGPATPPPPAPPEPTTTRATEPTPTTPTTSPTTVPAPPRTTVVLPVDPPLNPPEVAGATARVSWYGDESGSHTANGDRYDPDGLTFAHRSMAFGTAVRFCRNGTCVVATCTDRGPAAWTGRDFDLSRATFAALAPLSAGVATVSWAVAA